MIYTEKRPSLRREPPLAPGEVIRSEPWSFVVLALAAGLAAGFLLCLKTVRRGLRIYWSVRKVI